MSLPILFLRILFCAASAAALKLQIQPGPHQTEYDHYKSISDAAGLVESTIHDGRYRMFDGQPITHAITLLDNGSGDLQTAADPAFVVTRPVKGIYWLTGNHKLG